VEIMSVGLRAVKEEFVGAMGKMSPVYYQMTVILG